ncbi:hypothetical protein F2Q69_00018650 [Brassica cretica]|uniref:Uncharacterized protein n=1 Tax=Brassica cretica TaxID=69181 RepID=A0A8S9QNB0_BRACR|nr:hypothetical protein F2Q69_00018650 [Brassica cretica]
MFHFQAIWSLLGKEGRFSSIQNLLSLWLVREGDSPSLAVDLLESEGSILSRGGSPRRLTELSVSRWLSANRSGKAYVPCSSIIPVVDEAIKSRLIYSMEAEMAGSSVLKQGSFDRGIRSITGLLMVALMFGYGCLTVINRIDGVV